MPAREVRGRGVDQARGFGRCQRMDLRLRFIAAAQVSAHAKGWIRVELLILDGLRQHDAERSGDAANRVELQPLGARQRDQLAAVSPRERPHRAAPQER
ncbi:MAG TPA: hypothetical protein VNJ04_17850 [Gemmatimonadaceae bacterium]|nr:hypothetical protein [Gemmatimonadaceae bacterium]